MSERLWLVRHGETDWNAEGRLQGHSDRPLTPRGREQAAQAAARMTGLRFGALVSSDLFRARETAGILAAALGIEPRSDVRLREIDFGAWEGLSLASVRARFGADHAAFESDPLGARAPGGECARDVADRVIAAADEIAARAEGERVLLVAHALPIALLLCRARGIPIERAWKIPLRNLGVEWVDWPPPNGDESASKPA